MARVKAVLRRLGRSEGQAQRFTCGGLDVCLDDCTASIDGHALLLTKKEIEILWTLATAKGRVFSRDHLLNALWGYDYFGDSRTVDSHIKRLRAKLDQYPHPDWDIRTIWGVGYKFEGCADEK